MALELSQLCGQALAAIAFDGETQEWLFSFSSGWQLRVAAPWRVVSENQIVAGHEDDGHWFGLKAPFDTRERVERLVASQPVTEASIREFGDLSLRFGSASILQVFNHSAGYEAWQLFGSGKRVVVAQGGGRVVDSAQEP